MATASTTRKTRPTSIPCIPSTFAPGCTTDTDGDGTPDSVEGETTDTDGDGTPDYLEVVELADADGDGFNDQEDPANLDPCIPSTFAPGCTTDTDGDGTPDSVEGEITDSDGDGTPDYLEVVATPMPMATASTTRKTRPTSIRASRRTFAHRLHDRHRR